MRKRFTFALLSMLLVPLAMMAQNVTVSPSSGHLLATMTDEGETGFQLGLSALWRHEQLDLAVTGADRDIMTETDQIGMPSAVLGIYNGQLAIVGGHRPSFLTVSLPKGYRITGYRMVLSNDLHDVDVRPFKNGQRVTLTNSNYNRQFQHLNTNCQSDNAQNNSGIGTMRFYETDAWVEGTTNSKENYSSTTVNYIEPTYARTGINQIYAQAKDNNGEGQGDILTSDASGKEYVIERYAETSSYPMGNILYFRLLKDYFFYGISIKSFEIYFTSEGDFGADVEPVSKGQARSVVRSPFSTSKVDYGAMGPKTKDGQTYFAYDYRFVRELAGFTYLYQEAAGQSGVPAEGTEEKHIYPVEVPVGGKTQALYALCNDTYYIEPPVSVFTTSGWESPIGYRVVGATFNWVKTDQNQGTTSQTINQDGLYIKYESGNTTYYLNDLLLFSTEEFAWSYDSQSGAVFTGEGIDRRYLSCYGEDDTRTLTFSSSAPSDSDEDPGWFDIVMFTRDNKNYIGWDNRNDPSKRYYLQGTTDPGVTPTIKRAAPQTAALWSEETHQVTIPAYTPGGYTLTIYGADGQSLATDPIPVGVGESGSYPLKGLNNDAVKFKISGLPTDNSKQALLSVTLELQALDPYINQMNIVCHDPNEQLTLSQSFTADDFTVSGGEFKFNIPESFANTLLTFTFSDLWSMYGDNTYYTGSMQKNGTARYSFVTSPYFTDFDGDDDGGLYDEDYVGTASNPQPGASIAYNTKVYTSTAGDKAFKFNNAEDLSPTSGATTFDYFEDYPFTVSEYKDNGGNFVKCQLQAQGGQNEGTYYVFTADETRYNIAPTNKWQHRLYAYYKMVIKLETETYTADLTWEPIYQNTSYAETVNGKDKDTDKPMWGLKLRTKLQSGDYVKGYLTVQEIDEAITAAFGATAEEVTDHVGEVVTDENKQYDIDNDGDIDEYDVSAANLQLTGYDQILYIDASSLYSILSGGSGSSTAYASTLEELKAKSAPNCLFYLPAGTTSILDNFAFSESGTYLAAKDIVITDRKPFYAPYDIQVQDNNYAKYERKITWQTQGKNTLQTVLLPFTITVSSTGVHTEEDGTAFTLNQMKADGCLSIDHAEDAQAENFQSNVTFVPISGKSVSEANVPYMVQVTNPPSDEQTPFKVSQKAALVKASVLPTAHKDDYLWEGESATGSINSGGYAFQNYGSYSGKTLTAADGYFYYAGGMYLNSKNIRPSVSTVLIMYPFRAYFDYTYTGPAGAKRMGSMNIVFDENETSDIDSFAVPVKVDVDAPVYDLQGRMIALSMRDLAGKKLPRGIYVVNGVKIIVK